MNAPGGSVAGSFRDSAPILYVPDKVERADFAEFAARVVRLDPTSVIRLVGLDGQVTAWAYTPFDVLATRAVPGELDPPDLTVVATELLAALAVVRESRVDPGQPVDARWRAELSPVHGWRTVQEVSTAELAALAEQGIGRMREHGGSSAVGSSAVGPAELLDRPVLTVLDAGAAGARVRIPLRCVLALAGLGLLDDPRPAEQPDRYPDRVSISVTDSWVRLDAGLGAVVRRRRALLPLLVS